MLNEKARAHSTFHIQHSSFSAVILRGSKLGRRIGSGGLRGLQNRCFGAEASKGWFDSDTPPPSRTGERPSRPQSPSVSLGDNSVIMRALVIGRGRPITAGETPALLLQPYCLGASVRKPIFIAPPSCAASIACTA